MSATAKEVRTGLVPHKFANRVAKNRALEADRLRQRVRGAQLLQRIGDIEDELKAIDDRLKRGSMVLDPTTNQPVIDPTTGQPLFRATIDDDEARVIMLRVGVLKQRLDSHFKKLAKVLPDLKGVELTDPQGNSVMGALFGAIAHAASGAKPQEPQRDDPKP